MEKPSRVQIILWILLLLAAVILFILNFNSYQVGTYIDDANYVVLSQSLLYSDRYGHINHPDEPLPAKFPVGYPLFLTPFILLFQGNLEWLKISSLLANLVSASLLFWGWRWLSRTSYWWALGLLTLFVLSPVSAGFSQQVMSDAIFTTFCIASLVLVGYAVDQRFNPWWIILSGIVLAMAVLSRSVGLILPFWFFGFLLLKKGFVIWKALAMVLAVMLLVFGLIVVSTSYRFTDLVPKAYLGEMTKIYAWMSGKEIPEEQEPVQAEESSEPDPSPDNPSSLRNSLMYLQWSFEQKILFSLRRAVFPVGGGSREEEMAGKLGLPFLPSVLQYTILIIVILGFGYRFKTDGLTAFNSFGLFYYLAIFIWPWDDIRFLYPIFAQILFSFLSGIALILIWISSFPLKRLNRPGLVDISIVCIVVVMAILSLAKSTDLDDSRFHAGDVAVRSAWVKEETPSSAIIMSEFPLVDYIYSERHTVSYPDDVEEDAISNYLTKNHVDYILAAPQISWQSEQYVPFYSDQAGLMVIMLEKWAQVGKVNLVYDSGPTLIKVYKWNLKE